MYTLIKLFRDPKIVTFFKFWDKNNCHNLKESIDDYISCLEDIGTESVAFPHGRTKFQQTNYVRKDLSHSIRRRKHGKLPSTGSMWLRTLISQMTSKKIKENSNIQSDSLFSLSFSTGRQDGMVLPTCNLDFASSVKSHWKISDGQTRSCVSGFKSSQIDSED